MSCTSSEGSIWTLSAHQCIQSNSVSLTTAIACTGRLPSPIAAHFAPCGGWVEFHPDAVLPPVTEAAVHPKGAQDATDAQTHPLADPSAPEPPLPQPVVWFRMCNAEEFQTHKQLKYVEKDALSLWTLEEGMGQSLPLWFRADSVLTGVLCLMPYFCICIPKMLFSLDHCTLWQLLCTAPGSTLSSSRSIVHDNTHKRTPICMPCSHDLSVLLQKPCHAVVLFEVKSCPP